MEYTVYTAIIGHYEELKEPTVITHGWRYVCYTDQPITSDVWEVRKINVTMEPQRMARYIKINFHWHTFTKYALWLDASFRIDCNLNHFWTTHFKTPITAPAHPLRNCVYREVASCVFNKRGDADVIQRQGEAYRQQGVPDAGGIITSGVLMRQRTPGCIELCEKWWDELSQWSNRDQIAFAKVTAGLVVPTFKWDYCHNNDLKYFKHFKHRH